MATIDPTTSKDWRDVTADQPLPDGAEVPTSVSAVLRKFLDSAATGQLKAAELDGTVAELLQAWAPQPPNDTNAPS